jgi:hypothetical protein
MKKFIAITLSILMIATAVVAFAQQSKDDRAAERARIQAKMEELKTEILISQLGFSNTTVTKLTSIDKKYKDKKKALIIEGRDNNKALREALKNEPVNETELKSILKKRTSISDKMFDLRKQEENEISKLLSTEDFARYIVFNQRFKRQMRGFVHGGGKDRKKKNDTKTNK